MHVTPVTSDENDCPFADLGGGGGSHTQLSFGPQWKSFLDPRMLPLRLVLHEEK